MAKKTKLARSNAAHARLARSKKKSWIVREYHAAVLRDQRRFGYTLGATQKKALWNITVSEYKNRW